MKKTRNRISEDIFNKVMEERDLFYLALEMAIFDLSPQVARIPMCDRCPAGGSFCKTHTEVECDKILKNYFITKAKGAK